MKPLNTENLLSFYVPVNGLISYSALSINIMNPTLRTRWVQYYATWNLREFNSFVYLKILRFGWFDKFSPLAHCCWHWMLHLHTKAFAEGSSSEEDRILVSHRQLIQNKFRMSKDINNFCIISESPAVFCSASAQCSCGPSWRTFCQRTMEPQHLSVSWVAQPLWNSRPTIWAILIHKSTRGE